MAKFNQATNVAETPETPETNVANEVTAVSEAQVHNLFGTDTAETTEGKQLQILFLQNKVSMKQVTAYCDLSHSLVMKKLREPVDGKIYDPISCNWDAAAKIFIAKKIDISTLPLDAMAAVEVVAKVNATPKEMTLVVGDRFQVKYKPYAALVFTMVYKTPSYVCIQADGSEEPRIMANKTLISCGIVPVGTVVSTNEVVASTDSESSDTAVVE